jgi:hypothetical protein
MTLGPKFALLGDKTNSGLATTDREYAANSQLLAVKQSGAIDSTEADIYKTRLRGAQTVAAQRLAYANSGVDINSGTAAQVQSNTAGAAERDVMTLRANAAREAWGFKVQADTLAQNHDTERGNIERDFWGGFTGLAGSAIGSVGGGGFGG